jgi:DNA-binding transcriptional LysR family regulator
MVSAHSVTAEVADGRLVILDVEGLPVVRQWFAVRRSDRRLLPAADALWDFLSRSGHQFLPVPGGRAGAAIRRPLSREKETARR